MIRAAMPSVPNHVDAFALAARGGAWQSRVGADAFARLAQVAAVAEVEVCLRLALDERRRPRATGSCRFVAEVCCCRCLRDERVEVASRIDLRIVASEEELQALMPEFDAIVADGPVPIAELVEDDLLMSLPEIACEDRDTCPHAPSGMAHQNGEERHRPFAALAALKG